MRLLLPVSLSLVMFAAACGDDGGTGPTGNNDVVAVFPATGFVGRTVQVEVSGDTTNWDDSSTISFGDGVTVGTIDVAGPQSLIATLTIDAGAAPGKVDVSVTTGDETLTLAQAFELTSPVTATPAADFEQGAISSITIVNNDLLNPFDTSTDPDTGDFTGVTVSGADPAVAFTVADVTTDTITLSALIDVPATTSGDLTITSGGIESPVGEVAVTARTPQAITPGTPADFTMAAEGSLLSVTADAAGLLNLELTTTDDTMAFNPGFALLPASGSFNDLIVVHQNFNGPTTDAALDNRVVAAGDKFFVVALELGFFGAPGYPATFNAEVVALPATAVTDAENNEQPKTAQALTGILAEFDGVLTDAADVDCVKIAVTANQTIRVLTTDDDGATDNRLFVFNDATVDTFTPPAGGDPSTADFDSGDGDLGEDLVTGPLTAGTKAICITKSGFIDDITNGAYKAVITVQ